MPMCRSQLNSLKPGQNAVLDERWDIPIFGEIVSNGPKFETAKTKGWIGFQIRDGHFKSELRSSKCEVDLPEPGYEIEPFSSTEQKSR